MNEPTTLIPPVSERDHAQGPANAPITLVEYGDYQCPYCGEAHPVVKQLQKALGKRLRFIFRNFPLTEAHPYALIAAEAAEAAALKEKFWEMHDRIYENQDKLEPHILLVWAEDVGLDLDKIGTALKQGTVKKRIEEDLASGIKSGVDGTPSFFINGMSYDGESDYDSLRDALEEKIVN